MKKVICAILLFVGISFYSCSDTKPNAPAENAKTEHVVVEPESAKTDTLNAMSYGSSESEGFGRCSQSGCNCKKFEGRGDTCKNCGHAYRKHY